MAFRTYLHLSLAAAVLTAAGSLLLTTAIHAQPKGRIFELRTYTTNEGKLDALQTRFRDHTMRIFKKHGMTNVGRSEEHTSELQSRLHLVCRLLLEKKKKHTT